MTDLSKKFDWKLTRFMCPIDDCNISFEDANYANKYYNPKGVVTDFRPLCYKHGRRMNIVNEIGLIRADDQERLSWYNLNEGV